MQKKQKNVELTSAVIKKEFNGFEIEFKEIEGHLYANATSMAKAFPKKNLSEWTVLQETSEYINGLKRKNLIIGFPIIKKSGKYGGTWIHEKLILRLARFLDVEFEIQCDEWVSELLRTGKVELLNSEDRVKEFLKPHIPISNQISNVKKVARIKYAPDNSQDPIIEHHQWVCILLTGKRPSKYREAFVRLGHKVKSFSARKLMRKFEPAKAVAASFIDDAVVKGNSKQEIEKSNLHNAVQIFYNSLLSLGYIQ